MGIYWLIFCLLLFTPLFWGAGRVLFRRPETISTPAWLLSTNVLFILAGPVSLFLFLGENLTVSSRGAATIAFVLAAYSACFFLAYRFSAWVGGSLGAGSTGVLPSIAVLRRASDAASSREVFLWSSAVIAVQAVSFSLYNLGLSGGNMAFDYKLHVPYFMLSLYMLFGQASLGISALLARIAAGNSRSLERLIAAGLLMTEFAITILAGRRELLWFGMAIIFGVVWSGRRRALFALPLAAGLVYAVVFIFAPVFLRARILYSSDSSPGITEAYRVAVEEQAADVVGETADEARQNTSWRFRTYTFWEQMYEDNGPGYTEGNILLQAALMTLPRGLFGNLKFSLGYVDEQLLGTRFDICNNVSLESFVDLGYPGPAVYGVVFGMLFAMADGLTTWAGGRQRMLAVLAAGCMLRQLFGPEANPIAYFSEVRTAVIYALLAAGFAMALGPKTLFRSNPGGDRRLPAPARLQHGSSTAPSCDFPGPDRSGMIASRPASGS